MTTTTEATARASRRTAGHRGYTLMELLVAIALFGIISVAMYNLLFAQNRFFDTAEAGTATQQNTRIALKRIANDILLVGRGVNTLSLDNPDVIIPNDGTGSVNSVQSNAVTLVSIPNQVPQVPFALFAPRGGKSVTLVKDAGGIAAGLNAGDLIIVHDTNFNSSQMLNVTKRTVTGNQVTVEFAAVDSLLAGYPRNTSRMYPLNTVSYRLNASDPARPHLERQLNSEPWEKMVPGVEGLTFSYYDAGDALLTPDDQAKRRQIRKVRVQIDGRSVRAVDRTGKRVKISMVTDVTPRNMME